MATTRTIREDERGLYISVQGVKLRPTIYTTNARKGMKVNHVGGSDPATRRFGVVKFPSGLTEHWRSGGRSLLRR